MAAAVGATDEGLGDPFFDDEDILRAYTFDYDKIYAYFSKVGLMNTLTCVCCIPCCASAAVGDGVAYALIDRPARCARRLARAHPGVPYYACVERSNIKDAIYARHVALTRDGIKYVEDKHPTGCR